MNEGRPEVHAWFVGEDIDPADPLAAVKHRAAAIDQAAGVLGEVTRAVEVTARADAVGELASVLGEECFDPGTVWDTSTLPDDLKDAAGHIAVTLSEVEHGL